MGRHFTVKGIALGLILLSQSAHASIGFSGTWRGTGSGEDDLGHYSASCKFEMQIEESTAEISLLKTLYDCGGAHPVEIAPFSSEAKGASLPWTTRKPYGGAAFR